MHKLATLRPSLVGKLNERQVLRVVQAQGPLSRAEIARRSGLSAPTVSKAVASLMNSGLLEETAAPDAMRGRPATQLRLASEHVQVLGVVIDAKQCRVVSAGLDGVMHRETESSVPCPHTYEELVASLTQQCQRLMARPGITTLGLGVSLPGLIDYRRGCGVLSPNVPITNGQTPALDLGLRLGLESVLLQESHALCLAERHYGLGIGLNDFAMLDVGTGVGLGVMSGGQLLKGNSGLAGEIGHITVVSEGGLICGCGNRGCLETVASDQALAARISVRFGREITLDEILGLSNEVRTAIVQELEKTAHYLAIAVSAVVNLFNPSNVFIHSRLFEIEPHLFTKILELARGRTLPPSFADCRIVPAQGSKSQGAIAGIIQHLTNTVVPGAELL